MSEPKPKRKTSRDELVEVQEEARRIEAEIQAIQEGVTKDAAEKQVLIDRFTRSVSHIDEELNRTKRTLYEAFGFVEKGSLFVSSFTGIELSPSYIRHIERCAGITSEESSDIYKLSRNWHFRGDTPLESFASKFAHDTVENHPAMKKLKAESARRRAKIWKVTRDMDNMGFLKQRANLMGQLGTVRRRIHKLDLAVQRLDRVKEKRKSAKKGIKKRLERGANWLMDVHVNKKREFEWPPKSNNVFDYVD